MATFGVQQSQLDGNAGREPRAFGSHGLSKAIPGGVSLDVDDEDRPPTEPYSDEEDDYYDADAHDRRPASIHTQETSSAIYVDSDVSGIVLPLVDGAQAAALDASICSGTASTITTSPASTIATGKSMKKANDKETCSASSAKHSPAKRAGTDSPDKRARRNRRANGMRSRSPTPRAQFESPQDWERKSSADGRKKKGYHTPKDVSPAPVQTTPVAKDVHAMSPSTGGPTSHLYPPQAHPTSIGRHAAGHFSVDVSSAEIPGHMPQGGSCGPTTADVNHALFREEVQICRRLKDEEMKAQLQEMQMRQDALSLIKANEEQSTMIATIQASLNSNSTDARMILANSKSELQAMRQQLEHSQVSKANIHASAMQAQVERQQLSGQLMLEEATARRASEELEEYLRRNSTITAENGKGLS